MDVGKEDVVPRQWTEKQQREYQHVVESAARRAVDVKK